MYFNAGLGYCCLSRDAGEINGGNFVWFFVTQGSEKWAGLFCLHLSWLRYLFRNGKNGRELFLRISIYDYYFEIFQ